jgi:uncharacterized membrane protein
MTEGPGERERRDQAQAAHRYPARLARLIRRRRSRLDAAGDSEPGDAETDVPYAPAPRGTVVARAGHLEYDRILFFSDAVFAIAITLLVVDLPARLEVGSAGAINSGAVLRDAVPSIIGFGISFAAIGLFWLSHHSFFRFVTGFDRPLMLLNLLFLGTIAFLPYPTALLSRTTPSQAPSVIFYAACIGTSGLLLCASWGYACFGPARLVTALDRRARVYSLISSARIPVVFGLSIAIAPFSPSGAQYFWLTTVAADFVLNRVFGPVGGPGGGPVGGSAGEEEAELPPT